MDFQDLIKLYNMTNTQIKKELEKIYKERRKWIGGKGPFDKQSIRKREIVLIKQQVLSDLLLKFKL